MFTMSLPRTGYTCRNGPTKRTAILCVATFSAEGVAEEGLSVTAHILRCKRDGDAELLSGAYLAYVSKHAIARLHESGDRRDDIDARGVFSYAGVLGHLLRHSDKHEDGEICLHVGDALVVGSLKYAAQACHGRNCECLIGGALYDVRTVLPAGEVRNPEMLQQGRRIASHVVEAWFARRGGIDALVNQIPFLPRREDYSLRAAMFQMA